MDWYVPNSSEAASELRAEYRSYIERHAAPDSDFLGAELIFSELVTNAIENSSSPVWVTLDWAAQKPVLTVHDLGSGFALPPGDDTEGANGMPGVESHRGRGLMIVTHLTDELAVAAKAAGGTRVRATLPVVRPPSPNLDPVPIPVRHILDPSEADADGTFGREDFLRALVVQVAQTVEYNSGPAAAEATVAAVGSGIGERMEEAFRLAREISGDSLTIEEIAELFVGLKKGIDGDFFVIEATDEKIVLGNRRCPFGDAVKQAPSLCRMTSSVFGGIAARNVDGAAVHLQERIAVGDPECRVSVWLKQPPPEVEPEIHFYGRMRPSDE